MTTTSAQPTRRRDRSRRSFGQAQIVLAMTAVLVVVMAFAVDGFLTADNLVTVLRSVSALGVLGLAATVVILGRGLDLSLVPGGVVSCAVLLLRVEAGDPLVIALAWGVATAVAIGLLNGFLVAYVEIPSLFATIATGLLFLGVARMTFLSDYVVKVPQDERLFMWLSSGTVLGLPAAVTLFAAAALLLHLFLRTSRTGLFIYSVGDNDATSRLAGIPVRPVQVVTYVIGALLALLGVLLVATSVRQLDSAVGTSSMVYDMITVAVIGGVSLAGGRGSVFSVLVGTALVGLLLNSMTLLSVGNDTQNIAKGVVLIVALLLDSILHPRDEETARHADL